MIESTFLLLYRYEETCIQASLIRVKRVNCLNRVSHYINGIIIISKYIKKKATVSTYHNIAKLRESKSSHNKDTRDPARRSKEYL